MPSEQEWQTALQKLNKNLAPGSSNIQYTWIQAIKEPAETVLHKFAWLYFKIRRFPNSWSQSSLYPIPKHCEWGGDASNVRPIVLIECMRKTFTRILTNRLQKIIENHNILKGENFCSLIKESTMEPIKILTSAIEQ